MNEELDEKMTEVAEKGEAAEVKRFIDEGAEPNAKNRHGWGALHEAVFHGHEEVVKVLLSEGACPKAMTDDGRAPLAILLLQLPEWKKESTEKYNKGMRIWDMLKRAGRKE